MGSISRMLRTRSLPSQIPRVAVLVDTSTTWGHRLHVGIHSYERKYGSWQLFVEPRGLEEKLRLPTGWRGHGIIARIGNVPMAKELAALRVPVVNVSVIQLPGVDFPRVTTDQSASARLAAQHFLERGFKHFAYFSLLGLSFVADHQKAFADAVAKAGGDFAFMAVKPYVGTEPDWNLDLAKLGQWLKNLPKPVGVLTWNATSAREIIYACQIAGLLIPEEVAVLSGLDDELLCNLSQVPISGTLVAAETIGHKAARLLDQLMRGRPAPKHPELITPSGVATRQSTDTLAINDATLVKAMSFIRQNAAQPIQVTDVARQSGVSRRALERRFVEVLGRTPAVEIRRMHFERAKRLLAETDMPIPEVAEAAGFGSHTYMAYIFRQEINTTPKDFRQNAHHG